MRRTGPTSQPDASTAHQLVQAVANHEKQRVEALLADPDMNAEEMNWHDDLGWTPLTYAAFYGDYDLVKQLLHKGAMVNHLSVSRRGSTADGTTPLHACAVMKFKGQVPGEHYLETARVLMLTGGNPYQENSSGLTAIEVAGNQGNAAMKLLLEGTVLFKGTLAFKVPRILGDKSKDRYCLVVPRFPWYEDGQAGMSMSYGRPSFSLRCYKEPGDAQPVTVIPLDNARVVMETGGLTETGIMFVKTSPKLLKNIALMEVQSNQCVIGIRARPSDSQTAQQVMQTLSEVLKTLNAAVVTGSSGQLCEAAMGQALHHQGLIKSLLNYPGAADEEDTEPEQGQPTPRPRQSVAEGMPQSIPEEGSEDPKERRRSMSFSSLRKGFMRRMSIGDKPRRQSFAVGQTREPQRVSRISEEDSSPEKAVQSKSPAPARKSFSMFARRKSSQIERDPALSADAREASSTAASTIRAMPTMSSVPIGFFGPYREELLANFGGDRRQFSSRELPLAPDMTPVRRSLDVGDLDEPMLPSQRSASSSRQELTFREDKEKARTSRDEPRWGPQAQSRQMESQESWQQSEPVSERSRAGQPPTRRSMSQRRRASREAAREDGSVKENKQLAEMSPTTPPLPQKPCSSGRRTSRSMRPGEPPLHPQSIPDGQTPRVPNSLSADHSSGTPAEGNDDGLTPHPMDPPDQEGAHQQLPDSQAEEVMARLARRAPEANPHVRPGANRSERSRSNSKAPPPARSRRFSNKEMFGQSCTPDELFIWSHRPEKSTRGFTPPPKIQVKKPAESASTATPPTSNEELTEEHLAELAQSGWTKNGATSVHAAQQQPKPQGVVQNPSGGSLPTLTGTKVAASPEILDEAQQHGNQAGKTAADTTDLSSIPSGQDPEHEARAADILTSHQGDTKEDSPLEGGAALESHLPELTSEDGKASDTLLADSHTDAEQESETAK